MSLDFRFADEDDADEIASLVNSNSNSEETRGRAFYFRKAGGKITANEVLTDIVFYCLCHLSGRQ